MSAHYGERRADTLKKRSEATWKGKKKMDKNKTKRVIVPSYRNDSSLPTLPSIPKADTKPTIRTSQPERAALYWDLIRKIDGWYRMSDEELRAEVKKQLPYVAESASWKDCIRYLILTHVEKMIT